MVHQMVQWRKRQMRSYFKIDGRWPRRGCVAGAGEADPIDHRALKPAKN